MSNQEALASLLGTTGKEETVNVALREIAALRQRLLTFEAKEAENGDPVVA